MEEKMESEHSYSGDSSSSSDSSSGSSDGDDEVLEPVRIMGQSLELPQELCEDYSVFKEFFSMKTWEALEDKHKEELSKYLPQFTENEEEEKEKTIKMLFNHEPFHFTSPLGDFYNNLRQGNYRPDIAKMRKFLMKARAKQQKHKIKSYYAKLLPEVLISRERILAAARAAPPGPIPRLPLLPPKPSSKNNFKPLYLRAKQRYFEELNAIRSEVGGDESEDENYPEGPPEQSTRKRKQAPGQPTDGNVSGTLGGSDQSNLTSLECLKNVLAAHRTRRQYRENHPELNTAGITIDDIKQRVALVNGAKKLMFGGPKSGSPLQKLRRAPKKESGGKTKAQEKAAAKKVKEEPYETVENKPLLPNIKIKSEREESDSESSSFVDPITSPKSSKKVDHVEIKQEVIDKYPSSMSNINYSDTKLESIVKQEPPDTIMSMQNSARGPIHHQAVPIKLEDLDGIDMMALPVELADDSGEVIQVETSTETVEETLVDPDESLTETTHANFLSLVRALFPARAAHRASKQQLHARCAAVMRSPIAPLNTWYNLSDDWCGELDSALDFLAGERGQHPDDYVPYLQFLPESQMYQWIGAGRDCDAILGRLCERWLRAASPPPPAREPPPPRHPTTWSVRPATESELIDFRAQERKRFSMAAKPFTYIQYGYRSVVGPVVRGSGGGGAVLVSSRPRHAALPALVRDALARLPNGEGTRHHVLTLLRMSQWVAPCSDQTLLSAVSSVLDRLVSAKRDPVVKYDQRTAVWTYLHRHRSEEDWLKISSGRSRNSKLNSMLLSPLPSTSNPPTPVRTTPIASSKELQHTPPHAQMELEVGSMEEVVENASDSDVDVDDSGQSSSVPHMSSAQLLMQATQASQGKQVTLPPKPKGKLVATPPPKAKANVIPKAASVKQPAKQQSALMAQSAKQANLLAQAVRQSNVNQAKQTTIIQPPKPPVPQSPKQTNVPPQTSKQSNVTQAAKQAVISQVIKPTIVKQATPQAKPLTQTAPATQSPKQVQPQQTKQIIVSQTSTLSGQLSKSLPSVVAPPSKSPLIKQRPLQKVEGSQSQVINTTASQSNLQTTTVVQPSSTATVQVLQNKVNPGTRSLLIRPTAVQTTVTAVATTPATQVTPTTRRGVVRVLSPATPASGKSLISPRALMQQGATAAKKRPTVPNTVSVTTIAQSTGGVTAVVSSVPTAVTSSVTRTVQLAGGRTVQLAGGQSVQLAGGQSVQLAGGQAVQLAAGHGVQAVQLAAGHTLQLSALQLQHAVRLPGGGGVVAGGQAVRLPGGAGVAGGPTVQLPSGQTVQLAAPLRVSGASTKSPTPRPHQAAAALKTIPTTQPVQIPVSTVQLAGQTVQIAGQTVQLAGQSVQLTGHTVKLPSGQSVQVASQSVLPSQSVQLPSGQTVQIASGNVQTVQLSGSNVQLSGQSVQMPSGQTVQLGSQTVQLSGQTVQLAGQSVQLPSGQTLQLSSGQTVQLSSGQTLQLASGQTVQLANQTPKSIAQVVRSQSTGDKTSGGQPIVAKLLTNAQGQMLSLEGVGVGGGARTVQVSGGVRARGAVRVLSPATRLARPLLLTSAKPLHNIILQQSDGNTIRVTSSGAVSSSQTLVLSNIGAQTVTTSSTSAPVLKLQQAVTSAAATTSSGVRSVLMDGQQLKLVGGRHVLARILRPAHPPQ
ncbi:nuclear factor related to kappa-B-binding protein isoform X3 [Spodoptera frugiperda]|uniref:Nuclear factor related to kappa-B-binding protein isoform X3 n=1 Tax=Spodoptera frugiperda TaxID=7108 RepID=A0A9R0DNI3_SPOFR|nr:nuclear factor related to kappa-B-binding protein isoform X3 [Spodoptera frugiperda]